MASYNTAVFRQAVEEAKAEAGISSDSELARRVQMSQQSLSQKLGGVREFSPDEVAAIALALGKRPVDFALLLWPSLADEPWTGAGTSASAADTGAGGRIVGRGRRPRPDPEEGPP